MAGYLERINKYKAAGMILGGGAGFWLARKKELNRYEHVMIVLFMASLGMILPDVVDGVRSENKPRLRQLQDKQGADLAQFGKDSWIVLAIGALIIFFILKKEKPSKKSLLFLAIFLLAFIFMLKDTIPFKMEEKQGEKDGGLELFPSLLEAELTLFGLMAGLLIAYSRSDKSVKKYLISALLGAGGGFGLGYLIRSNISVDEIKGTKGAERQLREQRFNSRTMLLNIGKSIPERDKAKEMGSKLDAFIDGLTDKQLAVLDNIYESQKDKIERGKPISYESILKELKNKEFSKKDTDTFLQITDSFSVFITGKHIPLDTYGEDVELTVMNTIQELQMDEKGYLKPSGRKFHAGDHLKGKERWVWTNVKIGDEMRQQIRVVQLADNRYVLYIGIERK